MIKSVQVKYSYLSEQFANVDDYFTDLRQLVATGEFTLGPYVEAFERKFASYIGVKHAIGCNSGTDALILALKAVGVEPGDEVITVANTFIATVGAIVAAGATSVFVDCDEHYNIDVDQIEKAITPKTRAIIPVHWAGSPADIEEVLRIANNHGLAVVEDACQALGATVRGRFVGTFGKVNAFSMHPLKPLNVWGDGGIIVTDDNEVASFLRLYRNHGLTGRDNVAIWGVNTRLQPMQAVVASRLLDKIEEIIAVRIRNARQLDAGLKDLGEFVTFPLRDPKRREVYQLYIARVSNRDDLMVYLISKGIEAKIHYPIPLHLQPAAAGLGYKRGDFPVCERQAAEIITLPAHQYISAEQINYVIDEIHSFYHSRAG